MKKLIPIKREKIWGYESWIYSPLKEEPTKFEDGSQPEFGPLIKIIHATADLSIQIHPDDKTAKKLEGQPNGKYECWYILDAKEDACITVGVQDKGKKFVKKAIAEDKWDSILKKIRVEKGDFYNIPSGLIHGIGKGCTILEIQQPSDVTYRFYDYGRLENGQPRELHIKKALKSFKEVTCDKTHVISEDPLSYENKIMKMTFYKEPRKAKIKSVAIDLDNNVAYEVNEEEMINLSNFALIQW